MNIKESLKIDLLTYSHIERPHDYLGYVPIEIKALPEGYRCPMRVPFLTIKNTHKEFYWVTNFLETFMSFMIWQFCTSASVASKYKEIIFRYGNESGIGPEFYQWQGHDFSFGGMSSLGSACLSGAGHLLYFSGTDTIPAITFLENYYNANVETELVGGSVPAAEYAVICAGTGFYISKNNGNWEKYGNAELEVFRKLITEIYSSGIIFIISDTWDLWKVLTEYMVQLKPQILARDGKVVIRPDSGDPVKILTEYFTEEMEMSISVNEQKGVVELLWNVFGGTVNEKGYKVLGLHVGVIYGDSITLQRPGKIFSRLKRKGFVSQAVLGIGSYTYQYNTRDTFGMALKATYMEYENETVGVEFFKDPVTDDGAKKSAKGLLKIVKQNGKYHLKDQCTWEEEKEGELETVFLNGKLLKDYIISEVCKNTKG